MVMQLSDRLGSIVPIFNWSWWQIVVFVFAVDWLAIKIIMYFEPLGLGKPLGKGKRLYWRTHLYGDLILPFGIASSILVARGLPNENAWYTSTLWNLTVVLLGFAWIAALEYWSKHTFRQLMMPSQLWHTFIAFPLLFYLAGMTVPAFFVVHAPLWAVLAAIASYSFLSVMQLWDMLDPPNIRLTA